MSGLQPVGEQTIEVSGKTTVVMHLAVSTTCLLSACTGQPFELPDPNDRRPVSLCEPCRLRILER